jgi:hypothetical protein
MQYIALDATTIVTGDGGTRLGSCAEFGHGAAKTEAVCVLRASFYDRMDAPHRNCQVTFLEPMEDGLADDDNPTGLTGWKLAACWTGAAAASWGLVIGCAALARALL